MTLAERVKSYLTPLSVGGVASNVFKMYGEGFSLREGVLFAGDRCWCSFRRYLTVLKDGSREAGFFIRNYGHKNAMNYPLIAKGCMGAIKSSLNLPNLASALGRFQVAVFVET